MGGGAKRVQEGVASASTPRATRRHRPGRTTRGAGDEGRRSIGSNGSRNRARQCRFAALAPGGLEDRRIAVDRVADDTPSLIADADDVAGAQG